MVRLLLLLKRGMGLSLWGKSLFRPSEQLKYLSYFAKKSRLSHKNRQMAVLTFSLKYGLIFGLPQRQYRPFQAEAKGKNAPREG
jgi:hypothetical protein